MVTVAAWGQALVCAGTWAKGEEAVAVELSSEVAASLLRACGGGASSGGVPGSSSSTGQGGCCREWAGERGHVGASGRACSTFGGAFSAFRGRE